MTGLTVPEVRRLVAVLSGPAAAWAARLRWARWRQAHRATAARCHAARRARSQPPPVPAAIRVIVVPGTPALTDEGWARVAPLLARAAAARGRPPLEHRRILSGVLRVMRLGVPWRAAPREAAPWQTLYSRYTRWVADGTWARILTALPADQPGSDAAKLTIQVSLEY